MKTPDIIKKGLESCNKGWQYCKVCPYYFIGCDDVMCGDALEYIKQLEAEVNKFEEGYDALIKIVKRLEAERDAAIADMTEIVQKYGEPYCEYCGAGFKPKCTGRCWTHNEGFVWRGVQKEE